VTSRAALLIVVSLAACSGDDGRGGTDAASPDASSGEGGASCSEGCEACFACDATVTACASARDACTAEPDCAAFRACAGETDDPTTIEACRTDHSAGASAFCAYWGCLAYERCDPVCEDAVVCPR